MTRSLVVGVGGCRISNDPDTELVTYALGSCVAVAIHDVRSHTGGLLHVMLPDSALNPLQARRTPGMFADTGVRELLRLVENAGADRRRLLVWLAGGGHAWDDARAARIGSENYSAVRRALEYGGLAIFKEETGGSTPRTLRLHVGNGKVMTDSAGQAR